MTVLADYNLIKNDLVTMITSLAVFKSVAPDMNETDFNLGNMPLCDVRWRGSDLKAVTNGTHFGPVLFDLEIAAVNLQSRDAALTMVASLVATVQRRIVENPHFSAALDATRLGRVDVLTGEAETGFAASAVMRVEADVYADR